MENDQWSNLSKHRGQMFEKQDYVCCSTCHMMMMYIQIRSFSYVNENIYANTQVIKQGEGGPVADITVEVKC